jgi:hypothetical protein
MCGSWDILCQGAAPNEGEQSSVLQVGVLQLPAAPLAPLLDQRVPQSFGRMVWTSRCDMEVLHLSLGPAGAVYWWLAPAAPGVARAVLLVIQRAGGQKLVSHGRVLQFCTHRAQRR